MTTINTITSDADTTFSSVPTVQTQLTSNNSTKLASIGYVTGQSLTNYLTTDTNQTITGNYTINSPLASTTIDTATAGTLTLGKTTDTSFTFPILFTLKTFAQSIRYWAVGNALTTTSTGTAVSCRKVQSGQLSLDTSLTHTVFFSPTFTSKPVVLLGVQSTSTSLFLSSPEYLNGVGPTGFVATYGGSLSPTLVLNWIAIGT